MLSGDAVPKRFLDQCFADAGADWQRTAPKHSAFNMGNEQHG